MADEQDQRDTERAAIRERFRAERAQVAVLTDEEWVAERQDELRIVRERTAQLRLSLA
jgi:hypothetical protein